MHVVVLRRKSSWTVSYADLIQATYSWHEGGITRRIEFGSDHMVMMHDNSASTSSEQVTLENVNGAVGKNDAILGIAPVLRHRASHYCGQLDTHRGEIR